MFNLYAPTKGLHFCKEKGLHERLLKTQFNSIYKLNALKETPVLVVSKWNNMGLCQNLHLTVFSRVPLAVLQNMWIPFISKAHFQKRGD